MSIVDELSRTKTKEEIAQKRASRRESRASVSLPPPPTQSQPIPIQVTEAPRGRDKANSVTTSTTSSDGADLAPKSNYTMFLTEGYVS